MKKYIEVITAWTVAGILGVLATVLWLAMLLKGQTDGMAGIVIYAFIVGFAIGHFVLVLPLFLFLWRRESCWVWKFRYLVPLGFAASPIVAFLVKGDPIQVSDLCGLTMIGSYGAMLAMAYVLAANIVRSKKVSNHF